MQSALSSQASWVRLLNLAALAAICVALLFAFIWQIAFNEPPCPLCLLQRAAFAMAGIGLVLNLRFGFSPTHYGLTIVSSLAGAFAAGRQVLLHISPDDTGFGSPFLGLHFYTWAFIAFCLLIAFCALMLMLEQQRPAQSPSAGAARLINGVIVLFFALSVANAVSTTLECGFGECPDDPTGYLWLP